MSYDTMIKTIIIMQTTMFKGIDWLSHFFSTGTIQTICLQEKKMN